MSFYEGYHVMKAIKPIVLYYYFLFLFILYYLFLHSLQSCFLCTYHSLFVFTFISQALLFLCWSFLLNFQFQIQSHFFYFYIQSPFLYSLSIASSIVLLSVLIHSIIHSLFLIISLTTTTIIDIITLDIKSVILFIYWKIHTCIGIIMMSLVVIG